MKKLASGLSLVLLTSICIPHLYGRTPATRRSPGQLTAPTTPQESPVDTLIQTLTKEKDHHTTARQAVEEMALTAQERTGILLSESEKEKLVQTISTKLADHEQQRQALHNRLARKGAALDTRAKELTSFLAEFSKDEQKRALLFDLVESIMALNELEIMITDEEFGAFMDEKMRSRDARRSPGTRKVRY